MTTTAPRITYGLTATVNVRVDPATRHLIDEAVAREGLSIRAVVEQAIAEKWGTTDDVSS